MLQAVRFLQNHCRDFRQKRKVGACIIMGNLDRIATYVNWPANRQVSCLSLANSGFIYTGVSDRVICPLCGLEMKDWQQRNVNPLNEHRLRSPECPFFRESLPSHLQSGGLTGPFLPTSLRHDASSVEQSASNITDVYRSALERNSRHSNIRPTENTASSRDPAASARAVIDRANPDYSLLTHESARLSTFDDWPASDVVLPSALARAGLYYTGQADRACCAFCRGVLHHWQVRDDPDVEHRRHFPNCPFVRQQNVGNVPLQRDASLDPQVAALRVSDDRHSTSGVTRSTTASHVGDEAANNRPELLNQGLAEVTVQQQTQAGNSEEQRTTQNTTTTNTPGNYCAVFVLVKVLVSIDDSSGH